MSHINPNVFRENLVLLDPEVKTGLRDPKEEAVYLEILDHSGRPERR